MKHCPECGSRYTDTSLSFCLTDGSPLEDEPAKTEPFILDAEATSETSGKTREPGIKINIPARDEVETVPGRISSSGNRAEVKKGIGFGAVALIVGALLVVIAVLSTLVIYMLMTDETRSATRSGNTASTPDDVEELKKRIEELGGRIENSEAKTSPSPKTAPSIEEDEPEFDDEVIQRVNSPADGFLALRDQPSARSGNRIAKIPHGDIVVLGKCVENTETIQGRTGRWCRVRWEGKEGWVFDVWLTD